MKRKEISTTENTERTEVDAVASGHSVANTEDLPDGFQMTELGPLPKEWRVVRLGEVAIVGPPRIPRLSRDAIPFIPMALIPEGGHEVSQYELRAPSDVRSGVVVLEGDLLLAKITPCLENGKQGIVKRIPNGWGYATTEVFPIRTNEQLKIEFLNYYLLQRSVREALASKMEGTTGRQRLPKAVVIALPIPLPPLPEQRAIAHVLRTVQWAKEATEGVIAALKELKKSLMQHLFTYGPAPVGAKNFSPQRETELGPLPKEWRVVRLGEVAEKPQYGFTAAAQRDPVGPKMLRITDIQDGNVNWNAVPYCECGIEDIPKYLLEAGDILFARTGSVGKAFLVSSVPEPSIFASYLIRVRVDRAKLDPQFAFLFMQSSAYWSQITSQTHGAVQPNVNATQLRSLLLPLPPLDEQREIARMLQAVDAKIAAEQARRAALEELFKTLLHQLMTGQIRVSNITGAQQSGDPATGIGPFPQSED